MTTTPVATDHANSFQAVAFRVCGLDATGAPLTAIASAWITNQFTQVGFTPTYQAGADLSQLAADGSLCADYKSPDVLRYVALSIAVCNPEPELRALLGGGVLYTPALPAGGPVTGYGAPLRGEVPQPNGVSIEAWSRAIVNGKPASVNPFWMWIFPYAHIWPTGETILENGQPALTYTGYGYGNDAWDGGPDGAWPFASDRAYAYARTDSTPAITNGFNTAVFSAPEPPEMLVSTSPGNSAERDAVNAEVAPPGVITLDKPGADARKAELVAYAVQHGWSESDAKAATVDDLKKALDIEE